MWTVKLLFNKLFFGGKNGKFPYWIKSYAMDIAPVFFRKSRLEKKLRKAVDRPDYQYIMQRVNKYNKLEEAFAVPEGAERLEDFSLGNFRNRDKKFYKRETRAKSYYFDSKSVVRWFSGNMRWLHWFGDVDYLMDLPSVVKTRPICPDNQNSVILNVDKNRHFTFLNDTKEWLSKKDVLICRCNINEQPERLKLFNDYFQEDWCDLGLVGPVLPMYKAEWLKPKISLYKHLDFKFIACFEGNDVASNLKWVMSSNSIAVMCKPTCESWFLESDLVADYHYIEVKPDLSDLKERLDYYIGHPDEAMRIIENAHRYVEQFFDEERERLISLLVMQKYFEKSGQKVE